MTDVSLKKRHNEHTVTITTVPHVAMLTSTCDAARYSASTCVVLRCVVVDYLFKEIPTSLLDHV